MCMLKGLFMATIHYVQDFEQEKNGGGGGGGEAKI